MANESTDNTEVPPRKITTDSTPGLRRESLELAIDWAKAVQGGAAMVIGAAKMFESYIMIGAQDDEAK